MIRQCCVCKKIFDGCHWVYVRPEELADKDITHGYCEDCCEDFMQAVAEYVGGIRPEMSLTTA